VDALDAKRASKVAAPLIINNYQFVDLRRASLHVSESGVAGLLMCVAKKVPRDERE
jgi:hypothetical protein